jgi:hypothetical protein
MSKDDFTPYDLACMMALHGMLAAGAGQAHFPEVVAEAAVRCVDALFAELARKKEVRA